VSTQLFAQNIKQDVITLSLTGQQQVSVSTSSTVKNSGEWLDSPAHYKTGTFKLTEKSLIQAIAAVVHTNASYYSSKAKLVLVDGELSGFTKVAPALADSTVADNVWTTEDTDTRTAIANSTASVFASLPNGRHFEVNPTDEVSTPIGHVQPWGQIYIQDAGRKNADGTSPLLENVTYFFGLTVEECYDCFYLNSFISEATFTFSTTTPTQSGPPCCTRPSSTTMFGHGTDRYYLTLSFDNTQNNPYLAPASAVFLGNPGVVSDIKGDGVKPDAITYSDKIKSGIGAPSPYEIRFTLNGIVSYAWTLKFINSSTDLYPDFVGKASYTANGYGFIALSCSLLTGSASITETSTVKSSVFGETGTWTDSWFGIGAGSDYPTDVATPVNVPASLSFHVNANYVSKSAEQKGAGATEPLIGIGYPAWD